MITNQVTNSAGDVLTTTTEGVTVGFQRKINMEARGGEKYESAEASAFVQADVALDATDEQKAKSITDAFLLAKSAVYEQLGITFNLADDTNTAREVHPFTEAGATDSRKSLERTFGAVEQVASPPQSVAPAAGNATAGGVTDEKTWNGLTGAAGKKAAWEHLATNPQEWYDNSQNKKNPNGPDYKHVASGFPLWSSYKGQSSVPQGLLIPTTGFKNS